MSMQRWMPIVVKYRWLSLAVAATSFAAIATGSQFMPERYEASARVWVDTQKALKPLMAGLTFQPEIDLQVQMLARTLISRPNVEALVSMPGLSYEQADMGSRELLITRLMKEIKVASVGQGNLYDIRYRGSSPERAQQVVSATVDMFVRAGVETNRRGSKDAGRFIEEQIRTYEAKLTDAENRLKEFKVRNFSTTGISDKDHFTRLSAISDEVQRLRGELAAAEQSRDALQRELAGENPLLAEPVESRAQSAEMTDLVSRLELQRKRLDELRSSFTDAHPDVIGTRRVIVQLEDDVRRLREAELRALAKLGSVSRAATSPVYQKLRVSLVEAEALVASLRAQLATQQGRLDQARAAAGRVPQIEAELAQMNRDYEVLQKNYELMVSRRESAALSAKLDQSSELAEFRVVEPPRVSPKPVFPSRLQIGLIAVAASLLAGVGAAMLAEARRPTFVLASDLKRLSNGRPIIGTVSEALTGDVLRQRRAAHLRFGGLLAFLLIVQAAWVGWLTQRSPFG
jgi:polysaccharide chain length determinant protein (PEP-CTERM system associated)